MATSYRNTVVFYLNGERQEVGADRAGGMLADYIRVDRNLKGTKIVCSEGDCGACSVLRARPNGSESPKFIAINSCITPVAQMDGSSVVTVDALANPEPTPVQSAMVSCNGSQCGFCTPGFVMAMTGLVERKLCDHKNKEILPSEAKNALTGNLCRCTGYQPILESALSVDLKKCDPLKGRFFTSAQARELKKTLKTPIRMESPEFSFYAFKTLKSASQWLARHRQAKIGGAFTDLGVMHNKRKARLTEIVSLHLIPELYQIKRIGSNRMIVGSSVSLTELRRKAIRVIPELARFLDLFASPQIKNLATLAGNIANASPIGDTPPFLLVSEAKIHAVGSRGRRKITIEKFFSGYRKTALRPGEIIAAIEFNIPKVQESLALYKVSQRKDLDISSVNAAFYAQWTDSKRTKIKKIRIALGGVATSPIRLYKTEHFLQGKELNASTFQAASQKLQTEITPIDDLRASAAYRRVVAQKQLERFFRENTPLGTTR